MRDSVESALSSAGPAYMIRSLDHLLLRKPLQPTRACTARRRTFPPRAVTRGTSLGRIHSRRSSEPDRRRFRRWRSHGDRGLRYNDYR